MADVKFRFEIGSEEAEELREHVYTLIVDGIEISVRNLFNEPAEYSAEVRNQVMRELKLLAEDRHFAAIQRMPVDDLAATLKGEAAVNEAARRGRYESYNAHFGRWFENQLRNAARWAKEDQEGLLIGQLMLAILCHIHTVGFYKDLTMDWAEAVRTGRQHLWGKLTEVFAVA